MPHFCHIMTNNILSEILFSITSQHAFYFYHISFIINNLHTKKTHNPSKNIP